MAITYDFVHDEELADAILARLRANLPAVWRDRNNPVTGLKRIEFGDLLAWNFSGKRGDEGPDDLIPSIFVRFATNDEASQYSGVGGKEGRLTMYTVVHVFGPQQCYDLDAPHAPVQAERSKSQRAKAISKALWYHATNASRRRIGGADLTTDDTNAMTIQAIPGPVVYRPPEDASGMGQFAIGLVLAIGTLTQ